MESPNQRGRGRMWRRSRSRSRRMRSRSRVIRRQRMGWISGWVK